jgi:hypothetical protein
LMNQCSESVSFQTVSFPMYVRSIDDNMAIHGRKYCIYVQ